MTNGIDRIRVYFDNMVAINLFHELSFPEKLGGITSLSQLCALLAAITGYAARFYPSDVNSTVGDELRFMEANYQRPAHFLGLAFKYIDEALMECDDETPPLCVVQALIIATHCQLTRGVHGKAWRSLGLCVRLAYEMNLHLVDSRGAVQAGQEDPIRWQADEEKRRAWWAIWEMDVFASAIRRTPTAMDWTQMEILLPIEDADWFRNHPVPSCFMEIDPVHRWKALQESGNQSPKAWYLVINSLMKGAQMISSPRGVPYLGNPDHYPPSNSRTRKGTNSVEDAQQKLETLANAVHCFVLAIPAHLRYRNQYLSFDPPLPGHCGSLRQQHCSTYNIFVMTQLARLMIHRYDVFGVHTPTRRPEGGSEQFTAGDGAGRNSFSFHDLESLPLRQYFDAADNILTIVNQSCEEHIRHINPFLSSTVWLASAVQLVRKHFCRSITNPGLIKSRFDVLYLTYKRCVSFWDTQTALQQNLESLEVQLEANDNNELDSRERRPRVTSNRAQEKGAKLPTWVQHTLRSDQTDHHESDVGAQSFKRKRDYTSTSACTIAEETDLISLAPLQNQAKAPTRFLLDTPPASIIGDSVTTQDTVSEMQPPVGSGYVQQQQQRQSGMGTMSLFDFMHMPSSNKNQLSRPECLSPMAPSMISPLFLDSTTSRTVDMNDVQQDQDFEWRNFDLPSGIHDLLSGFSTY